MSRERTIRVLRYSVIGMTLLTIILFALSVFTLVNGLSGTISGGGFGLKLDKNGPNGDWILRFSGSPRNTGFIGTSFFLQIGILDPDGQYIALNSSAVDVPAGQERPFTVTLDIPYQAVQTYGLNQTQGSRAEFELIFSIKTLDGLVGLSQTLRISGSPK